MVEDSSSYGFSILERNHSPINKDGIKSNSTPLNLYNNSNDKLSPVDITGMYSSKKFGNTNMSTPIQPTEKKEKLQSILKNSTRVEATNNGTNNGDDLSVSDSLLRKHPELNLASRNGELNPVKGARVLFSPTKEILSYRKEYLDDITSSETDIDSSRNRRSNGFSSTRNRSSSINESGNYFSSENSLTNSTNQDASGNSSKESLVTRLMTDPTIPYVLSLYLQLFFNLLIISIVLYFVFIFVRTIKADINHKLEVYITDTMQEITMCTNEYFRNKCSNENGNVRAPALEGKCTNWSKCMNRDPRLIGKSKITAETFADIVNGFIRPISWKSLIFINLIIFGSILFMNVAFGSYRNSSQFNGYQSKENAEKLKELENLIKQQDKLLLKYEQLENSISKQSERNSSNRQENTPTDILRLQSPHSVSSQLAIRSGSSFMGNESNNSTLNSPLVRRKGSYK
ncbi:Di-sulfide bridge nucleocytoplasmic transport domain-containing protein [Scheffersomyces xylosifermentans]|uniref:Di-sulfide bridge nucleocytoplasmic transport domain-containing protein n=1 Tax=Scheffersomyces xylosifermentans TaxID=1304137 RepID=UPI00315C5F14